ncbi:protein LTV1 [Trichonephila clavata]|uniref:Protein LTV1 homolog n=1 Tax=Trichonephila clavata TaxID=2740835 RepID=A0A8X6H212_TRICU|nr:protein LTV1 [Trichonephila clavata]
MISDKYAAMLLPLVESCIPEDILRIWLRNPPVSTAEESYSQKLTQLKFLRLEVEGEQRVLLAKSGFKSRDISRNKTEQSHRNEDVNTPPTSAALVSTDRDTLRCSLINEIPQNKGNTTKRTILSFVQQFYNPIGILSAATLPPKIWLQEAWKIKLAWDDPLPPGMYNRFSRWLLEVACLKDSEDLIAITPAMFLMTNSSAEVTDLDLNAFTKFQRRVRFRAKLFKDLKSRFRKEYSGLLAQKRSKPISHKMKVGEIVLVENPNKKRLYWPLAEVLELLPGRDGNIRTMKLKCGNAEMIRPVQRLFPLEIQPEELPIADVGMEGVPEPSSLSEVQVAYTDEEVNPELSEVTLAMDSKANAIDDSKILGKLSKIYERVDDGDLEDILGQMANSDEDDGNYNIRANSEGMNFFSEADRSSKPYSNVQVEVFEEDEDDLSDDLHQFSDFESDEEFNNVQNKFPFTSRKADCPEAIRLLNEGFEKVFLEYTENQIGALDDEEICGGTFTTENENVMNFITTPLYKNPEDIEIGEFDEELKEKVLLYAEVEKPEKVVEIVTEKAIDFDCESVTSTYSNIYNHPTVIKEVSKIKKIKISNNPLKKGLTRSQLKQLDNVSEEEEEEEEEDDKFSVATSYMRVKGETPEQRRERKKLIKEERRENRRLKKENKLAFKEEKKLQVAQALNIQNTKGKKLL